MPSAWAPYNSAASLSNILSDQSRSNLRRFPLLHRLRGSYCRRHPLSLPLLHPLSCRLPRAPVQFLQAQSDILSALSDDRFVQDILSYRQQRISHRHPSGTSSLLLSIRTALVQTSRLSDLAVRYIPSPVRLPLYISLL